MNKYKQILGRVLCASIASGLMLLGVPMEAQSQEVGAMLVLRPHCEDGYDSENWIYGPVSAPGWTADEENSEKCSPFDVRDPQTLQTKTLTVGDTLEIDLVIQNPEKKTISSVRTWISYDATILEGNTIEAYEEVFTEVIPGELDFASAKGFAKIHANTNADSPPSSYWVPVARMSFTVIKEITPGTVMSFFNVQRDGHTYIVSKGDDGQDNYILQQEPSALFVEIGIAPPSSEPALEDIGGPCIVNEECTNGTCTDGICTEPSENTDSLEQCTLDGECETNTCYEGFCRRDDFRIPNDGTCRRNDQCASQVCRNGFCSGTTGFIDGEGCGSNFECASNNCINSVCSRSTDPQSGGSQICTSSIDCGDEGICYQGLCTNKEAQILTGGTCVLSTQCSSNLCVEGICKDPETYKNDRTAFSLLQVRNLRATTESGIAYLKWDDLRSSMLKAYNVYYGTTSGQYIQRKIVPSGTPSVTIRNLPEGTTYYFAIRGVDMNDEESAFGQEVGVEIGDPSSSTAPLVASFLTDAPGEHPLIGQGVGDLPGETGAASTLSLLLIVAAVIGTIFASRRQIATCFTPSTK